MTEEEWLGGRDARSLVGHLTLKRKNRLSDRRFRLLMCAACRVVWDQLSDQVAQRAVETVEQFADGLAAAEEVRRADHAMSRSAVVGKARAAVLWATWGPWRGHDGLNSAVVTVTAFIAVVAGSRAHELVSVVRCIAGNPFRSVAFDPAWRTSDAVALARGIYDDRAFDRMPILADALQDAGCDNGDILTHCRDTGTPHARGCWVVDLVLGKA